MGKVNCERDCAQCTLLTSVECSLARPCTTDRRSPLGRLERCHHLNASKNSTVFSPGSDVTGSGGRLVTPTAPKEAGRGSDAGAFIMIM